MTNIVPPILDQNRLQTITPFHIYSNHPPFNADIRSISNISPIPILSYPILSYIILSYLILSYSMRDNIGSIVNGTPYP